MAKKSADHHAKMSAHLKSAQDHLSQISQIMQMMQQAKGDQPPQQGGVLPPGVSPLGGQAQ